MREDVSILLAEDDTVTGQLLLKFLGKFGFEHIAWVRSGKEAIEKANIQKPDLVILDIILHDDIDGIAVADLILSGYSVPVIFLTANFSEESLKKGLDLGAYAFVLKPINKNQLYAAISIALKKHETETRIRDLNNQLFQEIQKKEEFETKLLKSEKLLHFAIEQMPVPVIMTTAHDFCVYKINSAALLLLSSLPNDIHNLLLDDYMKYLPMFSKDGIPIRFGNLPLVRALKHGEVTNDLEIIITKNNKKKWFLAKAAPLFDDNGGIFAGIMVLFDITDRKLTMEKLQNSEETARGIINATSNPVILISATGFVLEYNEAAAVRFSIDRSALPGKHISQYSADISSSIEPYVTHVKNDKSPFRFEETISGILYEISLYPMINNEGKVIKIALYYTDITEKRNLEKEIMNISERERQLIGQDIHDDLGQKLTAATFLAEALKGLLVENEAPGVNDLDEIIDLVKDIIIHAKKLSKGLCPVQLGPGGIVPALHELLEENSKIFDVEFLVDIDENIYFESDEISINMYHIVQESINNAIKHAGADSIKIILKKDENSDGCYMLIENNITEKKKSDRKGMGTEIMKYRANIIGALLTVVESENSYLVELRMPGKKEH